MSGYYNSSSYGSNSRNNGSAMFNLGFKKELKNGNGSFQLSISDIFSEGIYRGHVGALITDAFNSDVYVKYEGESYFRPIFKLSYSRSFGSKSKKASHDTSGAKEEQQRL